MSLLSHSAVAKVSGLSGHEIELLGSSVGINEGDDGQTGAGLRDLPDDSEMLPESALRSGTGDSVSFAKAA